MSELRYVFMCEWIDVQASVLRRYQLTYYPNDRTLEMYDVKNRRSFLKRTVYPLASESDLFIGATVTIFARQLKIVDYCDEFTRRHVEKQKSRTIGIILPKGYNVMGQIIQAVFESKFTVANMQMIKLDPDQAAQLIPSQDASMIGSDVIIAIEIVGTDVHTAWREMVEGTLGKKYPDCLYVAQSQEEGDQLAAHFFGSKVFPTTAVFNNSTCCIVRPHAIKDSGPIIDKILKEGFEISALRMWYLDKTAAEEFLEVYKGVLPEYHQLVEQMCEGPSMVMEIRQEDAVKALRQLVGPHDPEIAKHLRPNTLRAHYGIDKVRNAVHCTDLPEDGLLENEYFFNILYER